MTQAGDMHYLIDGHNLIARMPDITLDDPNDEMKLVIRLKSWASASRKRRVTVIFDGGLPGGPSLHFSNNVVKVIFASIGSTADALLIRRILRAKNPLEHTVVSSDQQIIAAAKSRRMPFLRSDEFAVELVPEKRALRTGPDKSDTSAKEEDPKISGEELDEWLHLFGPAEKTRPAKPPRRSKIPPADHQAPREKRPNHRPLKTDKAASENLSDNEVDAWLKFFENRED